MNIKKNILNCVQLKYINLSKLYFICLFFIVLPLYSLAPESKIRDNARKDESFIYSKEKLEYYSIINKTVNREQEQKTLLYIGSAGDISSALLISGCDKFIFVDALPFKDFIEDMDDEELAEAKAIYLEDKEKGWSRSEILDFDIRAAEFPLLWELGMLNAVIYKNEYVDNLGAYEVQFKLPGDPIKKTIYYYKIYDANEDKYYPEDLKKMIRTGIDVFLLKAFQPTSLPLLITKEIISSLSVKGKIICETYHFPFFQQFHELIIECDPDVEKFEIANDINLAYKGHTTLFLRKNPDVMMIIPEQILKST